MKKHITQAKVLKKGEREEDKPQEASVSIYLGFSEHACVLILFSPLLEQKERLRIRIELQCQQIKGVEV